MSDRFRKVDNPLTIIAIFAGITEVAASVALPFLGDSAQSVFVWFLFLFPFVLVAAFFITLNLNPKVLYAPADYRDEKHFLVAMNLSSDKPQVTVTSPDDIRTHMQGGHRESASLSPMSTLDGSTQAEIDAVNAVFRAFSKRALDLFTSQLITGYTFGLAGDGLFLLTAMLKDEMKGPDFESRILRASTLPSGEIKLQVVGHNVSSGNPEEIAELLSTDLKETILHRRKTEINQIETPNKAIDVA